MTEEAIFERALELQSGSERDRFLAEACGEDLGLRSRICRLIDADGGSDSLLDNPIAIEATVSDTSFEIGVGTQIGPYKLLEQIGEGGMGVVYVAERKTPIRKRVALKVIKPGMGSRAVIARFEAERQALALMDHPNIARVLDAGTTQSGQPYFVMEHIKGVPITDYCNERCLSTDERLKLFRQVCGALQHSHQKGVIHRDIKPSNILVADYDHVAVPKVIDFGVAKALNQSLTDKTLYTQRLNIVGTLQYMSPEQAKLNQRDIDTRSDIYSLGVVLYELLTGRTPFERKVLEDAGLEGMCRIIREQEPARPSMSVATLDAQTATRVATQRGSHPDALRKAFRGDLDRIVMMALAKERNRRYATADALADDLLRYANKEPVKAVNPSILYLLRKSLQRHSGIYTVAATLIVAMLVTAVSLFVGMQTARAGQQAANEANTKLNDEKRQAVEAKETSDKALLLVLDMIGDASPGKLDAIAKKASTVFRAEPKVEYKILREVGLQSLQSSATRPESIFARLDKLASTLFGEKSGERAEALRYLAYCRISPTLAREALDMESDVYGKQTSQTLSILGGLQFLARQFDAAEKNLTASVQGFDEEEVILEPWEIPHLFLSEIDRIQGDHNATESWRTDGLRFLSRGKTNGQLMARKNSQQAAGGSLEFQEWYLACVAPEEFQSTQKRKYHSSYARVLRSLGRHDLADRHSDSDSDSGALIDKWSLAMRGVLHTEVMNFATARIHFAESLELGKSIEAGLGQAGWAQPWREWQLAMADYQLGNLDQAKERLLRLAEANFERNEGFTDLANESTAWDCRAYLLQKLLADDQADAEELLALSKRLRERLPENYRGEIDGDPDVCIALAQRRLGNTEEALDLLENSLKSVSLRANEPTHWMEQILFELYRETGSVERSSEFFAAALQHRESGLHWNHPEHGLARYRYGKFLVENNHDLATAKSYLQDARRMLANRPLVPQRISSEIDALLVRLSDG